MHAIPIQPNERIAALDILRGFALLGIFAMNLPFMGVSFYAGLDGVEPFPAWYDMAAQRALDVLFDGKFNSLFSLLFAIGFTIQLGRLERSAGAAARAIYARRLLVLFGFGVLHAMLVWPGDVLHIYAIAGFALLFARKLSTRALLVLIGVGLATPGIIRVITLAITTPERIEMLIGLFETTIASNDAAYTGSFAAGVAENAHMMALFYAGPGWSYELTFWISILATMFIGLIVGRERWIQDVARLRPALPRWQWSALALGLATAGVYALGNALFKPFEPTAWKILFSTCYAFARVSLMAFYAITIVRLAASERWRPRLSAFALAGRMPLTNYLMQSLIGCAIFHAWGFGLWGGIGWAGTCALAFAIFFGVQVPLSGWWLARFRFGPMEWLWRRLTYGAAPAHDVVHSAPCAATTSTSTV
jgi:uncharacterized protein